MQKILLKFPYTATQTFFIERSYELLHKNTIDTFRLRLHNPKTAINELIKVCDDLAKNKLKNHDYAINIAEEVTRIINEQKELIFTSIHKKYFLSLIDKKKIKKDNYPKIVHAGRLILEDNKNYINRLFQITQKTILKNNLKLFPSYEILTDLERITQYLYIELISLGYSKYYLDFFVKAIFSSPSQQTSFFQRFSILKTLIGRPHEKFTVVFVLEAFSRGVNLGVIKNLTSGAKWIEKKDRVRLSVISNREIEKFLDEKKHKFLIQFKIEEKDYYKALDVARGELLKLVDLWHLSLGGRNVVIGDKLIVVGEREPKKARIYSNKFRIEGHYRSSKELYETLSEKFAKLATIGNITQETFNKIYSGIRYLRLGTAAKDLGNKLINYWIGLEYIFSVYDADSYTVGRLREYFKKCHAMVYLRRNLNAFHKEIKKWGLHSNIKNYNSDLKYLLNKSTYEKLINQNKSELLKVRATSYLKLLEKPSKVKGTLQKHQQNLEWNLTRIYRIRNEIVHNAAIKVDIVTLVSHLRYYLTFILNSLLDFLIEHALDIDDDGKLSIDDFFILQDLKLSSLEHNPSDLELKKLIQISDPLELFL